VIEDRAAAEPLYDDVDQYQIHFFGVAVEIPDSLIEQDQIGPIYAPPFDIIHQMAAEALDALLEPDPTSSQDTKKQAAGEPTTCPIMLPRLDSN
jgi:hypothetical protein